MKLLGCLLALFLVSGCFDKPQPPPNPVTPQTKVQRVDNVLKDTADDLELGAKVRTIVYEQDSKRVRDRARREKPASVHDYTVSQLLFGVVFLLIFALIHHSYRVGCEDAKSH